MENSNAQCPFQVHLSRMAKELKDVLKGLRVAESEVQFELEVCNLERIIREMEWKESGA